MNISNLKIGARLALGYGLILMLVLILIVTTLFRFAEIGQVTHTLIDEDWVKADTTNIISSSMRANARRTMELIIVTDSQHIDKIFQYIAENKKTIDAGIENLDKLVRAEEGKKLLAEFKEKRLQYVTSFTKVGQLVRESKRDEATQLVMTETMPALDAALEPIFALSEFQKQLANEAGVKTEASIVFADRLMIGMGLAVVVLGVCFAYWITLSITRPLGKAVQVAETVAGGDLSSKIEVTSTDETGQLMQALKSMNESLVNIVSDVRSGTDTIATASSQISAGNIDLSSRTEQQASSLEETAASMEELTSTVRQNADNARLASQLAVSASQVASKGGEVVSQVVDTMDGINESSRKVVDIISVIDSIAFQTNILALNAAVEAARAGEQGRGFAVVASEVRNLAQRSAAAAKEIKELISDSVGKVENGSKLVGDAGITMQEIVQSIQRVTDIMGEITSASTEQAQGIEQINQAVTEMDTVTQQNAALVEEASAAAQALENQANGLLKMVSVFKLDERQQEPSPLSAVRSPKESIVLKTRQASLVETSKNKKLSYASTSNDNWDEF